MGGRYLVTGVQLGMLKTCLGKKTKPKICNDLFDQIMNNQFIGESETNINDDAKEIQGKFEKGK